MVPCWGPALLTEDLPAQDTCLEPRVWGGLVASRAHLPAGGGAGLSSKLALTLAGPL